MWKVIYKMGLSFLGENSCKSKPSKRFWSTKHRRGTKGQKGRSKFKDITRVKATVLQASHNKGRKGPIYTTSFKTQETAGNNFIAPCCVSNPTSLLSPQLHTKSPLQFAYNLLIRNGFSGFILLNYLGLLVDQLHREEKNKSTDIKAEVIVDERVRKREGPVQVEPG
jgi:hypothetical protein